MTIKMGSMKADLKKEREGSWEEHPDYVGAKFFVRSLLYPPYRTARDMLGKKMARQYKDKNVPSDVMTTEVGKLFSKHILLGWSGFDDDYTPELAEERLTDPEWRALVAAVEYCAAKVSDIDVQFIEDEGKNSEPPSDQS